MEFKRIERPTKLVRQAVEPDPPDEKVGLLQIRTANACINDARNLAIPKCLCGNLWFEGEVGILFADTNIGKSICAVQVANNVSRGENIDVFGSEASQQVVLYLDFELSDKAACKLKCIMKNEMLLKIELRHFEVNYDLSSIHKEPCGEYYIEPKKEFAKQYNYKLIINDCDTISKINDISIPATYSCNCQ